MYISIFGLFLYIVLWYDYIYLSIYFVKQTFKLSGAMIEFLIYDHQGWPFEVEIEKSNAARVASPCKYDNEMILILVLMYLQMDFENFDFSTVTIE